MEGLLTGIPKKMVVTDICRMDRIIPSFCYLSNPCAALQKQKGLSLPGLP